MKLLQTFNHSTSTTSAAGERHPTMEKFLYQICAVAFLLIGLAQGIYDQWIIKYPLARWSVTWRINFVFVLTFAAAVLFADPKDATVEANEWAQFNCTVRCGYTVGWYMAGHSRVIKRNNTVPGLLIKRRRASCTESNEWTFYFEVFATEAFNKSTFYCAAYETRPQENSCSCGTDGRCYSRPALLTGEHIKIATFVFCFLIFSLLL